MLEAARVGEPQPLNPPNSWRRTLSPMGNAAVAPSDSAPEAAAPPSVPFEPLTPSDVAAVDLIRQQVLSPDVEFQQHGPGLTVDALASLATPTVCCDYLLSPASRAPDVEAVFHALRWGGQFVCVAPRAADLKPLIDVFMRRGFEIRSGPRFVRRGWWGLPLLSRKTYYFIARKVEMTLPRELSDRFTYHVYLSFDRELDRYVVVKEIPTVERVSARLRHKFPDAPADLIERRALKFTEKVFPLFLTREAAMLKLLARDLPDEYRHRVPKLLDMEKDSRGFVRRIRMSWMRNTPPGGRPLSQIDFALQSADLLRTMHDEAGIIHLDLRLDNMVVTEHGVGFVDFGSAVRIGENIEGNPLLSTIFDELMKTSQIQRMLEKMMVGGMVTNRILNEAHGKVDKGVDLFYLALQINKPLANPDFRGLVQVERRSEEAEGLAVLTDEVLKPKDPSSPAYRTAADLLRGIRAVASRLTHRPMPT